MVWGDFVDLEDLATEGTEKKKKEKVPKFWPWMFWSVIDGFAETEGSAGDLGWQWGG